jgi:hypothetical protein
VEATALSVAVGRLSRQPNISLVLASQIITLIEDSGAAQTDAMLALGVVQSALYTLKIPAVPEEEG